MEDPNIKFYRHHTVEATLTYAERRTNMTKLMGAFITIVNLLTNVGMGNH
jgi:hypothetical protein